MHPRVTNIASIKQRTTPFARYSIKRFSPFGFQANGVRRVCIIISPGQQDYFPYRFEFAYYSWKRTLNQTEVDVGLDVPRWLVRRSEKCRDERGGSQEAHTGAQRSI